MTLDFSYRLVLKRPWCYLSALGAEDPSLLLPFQHTEGAQRQGDGRFECKRCLWLFEPHLSLPPVTFFHPCLGILHVCEVPGSLCAWMQVCFEVSFNSMDCCPLFCRAASLLVLSLQSSWLISILPDCVAAAPSPLCSSQACSGLQINILGFLVVLNICIYQVFLSAGCYFNDVLRKKNQRCRSYWQENGNSLLGNVLFEIPAVRFSCLRSLSARSYVHLEHVSCSPLLVR